MKIFVAVLIAIAMLTGHALANQGPTTTEVARACFPAADWDAYSEDRPCNAVTRPYEDGSGRLILGTYGSAAATCVIPNPYEERGHFVIHCNRVPNR